MTRQPPSGPVQFDQHAQERVIHGLGRSDPDQRSSITAFNRKTRTLQRRAQVDSGVAIGLARRKPYLEVFSRLQRNDFDFRIKRLSERRADGQLAKACRV
ncbi:MAG: hypothetical protein ACREVG_17450 [Burkholderiales bacterium]